MCRAEDEIICGLCSFLASGCVIHELALPRLAERIMLVPGLIFERHWVLGLIDSPIWHSLYGLRYVPACTARL